MTEKNGWALRPRLMAAAELAAHSKYFADIGSDHALLPAWLLLNRSVRLAYAADISPHSAQKAAAAAKKYHLENRLLPRLSDGLANFSPDDADTFCFCGMGGDRIAGILSSAPWIAEGKHRIIVQSMSSLDRLNEYLSSHGFAAEDERIVRDAGRLYSVALLSGGHPSSESIILPSEKGADSPLYRPYLRRLLRIAEKALGGAVRAQFPDIRQISKLEQEIMHYQMLLPRSVVL